MINSSFEALSGSEEAHFTLGLLNDGHSSANANPFNSSAVYVTPDPAPAWAVSSFAGGTMNPSDAFMPPGPLSGRNVGYSRGAVLSQVIPIEIQPSTDYIVSVGVGHPVGGGAFAYHVWLSSDGYVLADDSNSVFIPSGTWGTSAVAWSSPGDVLPGSKLTLNLASDDGIVLFDNAQIVSLTVAPEPTCGVILLIPAWAALHRRRVGAGD